jgi:3-methyl-2-oxobutanoate hydroxymethyltransferase
MTDAEQREKVTLTTLYARKAAREPVTWLTAYDYPTANLMDRAGVEMILVGDSLAMTVLGHETTLPVTMNEMVVFTSAVCRAVERAFVVADMPYMSYQVSTEQAIRNAGRFMARCGTDAVKLEGGAAVGHVIEAISNAGIPTIAHIGLTPQSYTQLGGFKAQGRTAKAGLRLIEDAEILEAAGACAILVECVPSEVTEVIHERAGIPVYGIGSGPNCDGQLLISHDLLGLFERFTPRFVKRYADLSRAMVDAFSAYCGEVKARDFPTTEHCYPMRAGEAEQLKASLRLGGVDLDGAPSGSSPHLERGN